jgi:hypothetical protein
MKYFIPKYKNKIDFQVDNLLNNIYKVGFKRYNSYNELKFDIEKIITKQLYSYKLNKEK